MEHPSRIDKILNLPDPFYKNPAPPREAPRFVRTCEPIHVPLNQSHAPEALLIFWNLRRVMTSRGLSGKKNLQKNPRRQTRAATRLLIDQEQKAKRSSTSLTAPPCSQLRRHSPSVRPARCGATERAAPTGRNTSRRGAGKSRPHGRAPRRLGLRELKRLPGQPASVVELDFLERRSQSGNEFNRAMLRSSESSRGCSCP